MPMISVLIPAYRYISGVIRILEQLEKVDSNNLEIIVFDDSPDTLIQDSIEFGKYKSVIKYKLNLTPTGAVDNWNNLVNEAKGDYILIIHHDDFPFGNNFIYLLSELINSNINIDVFSLGCILVSQNLKVVGFHTPSKFRNILIKLFPGYILRRNYLGPVSSLVFKRAMFPLFDRNLKWFVDVEFYYRLRKKTANWLCVDNLNIASELGRDDSITSLIKDSLVEIKKNEKYYLRRKHSYNSSRIIYFIIDVFMYTIKRFNRIQCIIQFKYNKIKTH